MRPVGLPPNLTGEGAGGTASPASAPGDGAFATGATGVVPAGTPGTLAGEVFGESSLMLKVEG